MPKWRTSAGALMHMADALLSPAVGTTFWAATIGTIGYASRKLKKHLDERMVPLMGVLGAFVFAGQMINFTIPGTGSSGHLAGGLLMAAILGPEAAFVVLASVLTVQALFFADGGLMALGCNIWNMGFYACFIAYPLIYKPIAGNGQSKRRILLGSLAGSIVALQLGAFSVVVETVLSGRSELPFGTFLMFMQPIHLGIGIVEGFVTAGVVGYVRHARPELMHSAAGARPLEAGVSIKKVLLVFLAFAVLTGGVLSWFASTHPDGLEWSIKRVTGKTTLTQKQDNVSTAMKDVQEKTTLLPDYGFRDTKASPSGMNAGTSASGILGAAIVLGLILAIGMGIHTLRVRKR